MIMLKRGLFYLMLGTVAVFEVQAQSDPVDFQQRWQVGFFAGPGWLFGDLGGKPGIGKPFLKDWTPSRPAFHGGAQLIYNIDERFSISTHLSAGSLRASDSWLPESDKSGRRQRNLSVKTGLLEFSTEFRYTARYLGAGALNNNTVGPFAPYLSAGVGVIRFEPRAYWQNQWVSLRPLRTEGQGMKEYADRAAYGKYAFFIPVTAGFTFKVSQRMHLTLEAVFRKSFTDYLDDVSQKYIDPRYFDQYLTGWQAIAARALYDRSGEVNGNVRIYNEGEQRGLPGKDSWVSLRAGLIISIGPLLSYY